MLKLKPEQLIRSISPAELSFSSTQELPEFREILGQARANQALEFGIGIQQPGYNLYVAGDSGTGRIHYLTEYLRPLAANGKTPADWLYVNHFERPAEPRCIAMPQGQGVRFQRDIEHLLEEIMATFPAAFENPAYIQQKTALQNHFNSRYDAALSVVEKAAAQKQIAVYRENGLITFGIIADGQIADEAYFSKMDEAQREAFHQNVNELEKLLNETLVELPQWQRDVNNQLRALDQHTIRQSLKPLFDELLQKYQGHAGVQIYLGQMSQHLPRVIEENFSGQNEDNREHPSSQRKLLESLYRPNVIIRSKEQSGAPIVLETNPTYGNLFGRVNHSPQQGEGGASYLHIVAGAVHRANGGYLLVDIEKVLGDGRSWEALKRVLKEGAVEIDALASDLLLAMPSGLKPQPIPVSLKVIMIGPRSLYYTLAELDPEFNELFRVLVDFDSACDITQESLQRFAALMHTRAKETGIAELTAAAVARLGEYACRLAGHQQKLSTHIDQLMDIVTEANYWRMKAAEQWVDRAHIEQAIAAREHRHARFRDGILEDILSGFINIATAGAIAGQVNGLAVIDSGDTSFGCPLRITATTHPGSKGVVDIEREVKLGQAVHSKGVMILTGYLCGRYAKNFSLAMSANIAVEQSYGFIDGDSASLAEVCALLSSLVGIPLRQDIALTGSVSQFGDVQAIGGANEKIEGFFDICQARGLTGSQGVIIPKSNQVNLMLAERVVNAVNDGRFSIWCVATVDEAMGLLTGREMGIEGDGDGFPPCTVNAQIIERLKQFARCAMGEEK